MEIKNAKITGTSLGNDDHGPSFWIYIDYGGAGQGFGGYALGGEFTNYVIMGILNTLKVNKWEDLEGTPVRVKCSHEKIQAIGHYLEEKWFDPSEYNNEHS